MNTVSRTTLLRRMVPQTNRLMPAVLATCVLTLVGAMRSAADQEPPDARALLARAREVADLRTEGSAPFELHAQIEATITRKKITGEYVLIWLAPNWWREELHLGNYQRLRVGADGGYNQLRSMDYSPAIIFEFDSVMSAFAMTKIEEKETFDGPRMRTQDGISMACVQSQVKGVPLSEHCFDPQTGSLLRFQSLQNPKMRLLETVEVVYSQIEQFGEKRVPRAIRMKKGDWYAAQISVTELKPARVSDSSLFATPPQSEFWPSCRDMALAEIVESTLPQYPDIARQQRQQGIVTLYFRIEPDGTVSHVRSLSAPGVQLEAAATKAVRGWKYKPATCKGKPIRVEITGEVKFELR